MVTEMVGFHTAVLIPDTLVAVWTGPGGYRGSRLLAVTMALPVTVADGVL